MPIQTQTLVRTAGETPDELALLAQMEQDATQTAEDRVRTGEDRQQTGLDRAAAEAAALVSTSAARRQAEKPDIDYERLAWLDANNQTGTRVADRAKLDALIQQASFTGSIPAGVRLGAYRAKYKNGVNVGQVLIARTDTLEVVGEAQDTVGPEPPRFFEVKPIVPVAPAVNSIPDLGGWLDCNWAVMTAGDDVVTAPGFGLPFSAVALKGRVFNETLVSRAAEAKATADEALAKALANAASKVDITAAYGRLAALIALLLFGTGTWLSLGDSFMTLREVSVPFWLRRLLPFSRIRGVVVSKRVAAPGQLKNSGGFRAEYKTPVGGANPQTRALTFDNSYLAVEGSGSPETMGFPTGVQQIHFSPDYKAGASGRCFEYRYEVSALDAAVAPPPVTNAEAAATPKKALKARLVFWAPQVDALRYNGILRVYDRLDTTPHVLEINPFTGTGIVGGAPTSGDYYYSETFVLDNPAQDSLSEWYYAARVTTHGIAEDASPGTNTYVHPTGLEVWDDTVDGWTLADAGDGSWSFAGWGVDADPTPTEPKQAKTADMATWLGAIHQGGTSVCMFNLNGETGALPDGAVDSPAARQEQWVRWLRAIVYKCDQAHLANGLPLPHFFFVIGYAQRPSKVSAQEDDNQLRALQLVCAQNARVSFINLRGLTEGAVFEERRDPVTDAPDGSGSAPQEVLDVLIRAGRPDLAAAPYHGILLDAEGVHLGNKLVAEWLASLIAEQVTAAA